MSRIYVLSLLICLVVVIGAPKAAYTQESDSTLQLLRSLSEVPGPSGFEEPVRKIMVEQMKPFADRISYDGMGSVIAQQGATGPRIMVDAHMDELGGVIRRITPDGYLSMQMLAGWLDQALVDQRWTIVTSKGQMQAITGIRDVHIVSPEERPASIRATLCCSMSEQKTRRKFAQWALKSATRWHRTRISQF